MKTASPIEKDIQGWILISLGQEKCRLEKKAGKTEWVRTGLYVRRDGKAYFWRCNSGKRVYDYKTKAGKAKRGLFKAAPKGTADIQGVVLGTSVAFEVKREGEKQTPEQVEWQKMHEAAGGLYYVVRKPLEAKKIVEDLIQI